MNSDPPNIGERYENKKSDFDLRYVKLDQKSLNDIIELINQAWGEDYGTLGYLTYSIEQLKWSLSSPEQDQSLILGVFHNDKLVGFNAVLPINLETGQKQFKAGISTYLSVHPRFRRQGIAKLLLNETFEQMIQHDYDVCFAYFDTAVDKVGGKPIYRSLDKIKLVFTYRSNWLVGLLDSKTFIEDIGVVAPLKELLKTDKSFSKKLGRDINAKKPILDKILIKSHNYFNKITQTQKGYNSIIEYSAELENPTIRAQILELLNTKLNRNRVIKKWTIAELKWYLGSDRTFTILHKNFRDEIDGIINYKLQDIQAARKVQFSWIDNFNLRSLSFSEKRVMILFMMAHAKQAGSTAIILPIVRNFSKIPFIRCGFIPYPRNFELFTIPLSKRFDKSKVVKGRFYQIDVR